MTINGEMKESTLTIPTHPEDSSDSECPDLENGNNSLYHSVHTESTKRVQSSGVREETGARKKILKKKNKNHLRVEPIPPPMSMINVTSTLHSPLPGIRGLQTQRSTLEVMIPNMRGEVERAEKEL